MAINYAHTPHLRKHLLTVGCKNKRCAFTRLRISSHDLMIEKGRYKKPKKLEVKDRICTHCNDAQIEDEMHFMMHCNLYHEKRKLMIDSVNEVIPTFSDLNKSEQ
jgi:hypothetical protein